VTSAEFWALRSAAIDNEQRACHFISQDRQRPDKETTLGRKYLESRAEPASSFKLNFSLLYHWQIPLGDRNVRLL
jgi:hypothetical protein